MRRPFLSILLRVLILSSAVFGAHGRVEGQSSPAPTTAAPTTAAPTTATPATASTEDEAAAAARADALLKSLRYQKGSITLQGGLAKLEVPDTFRYLAPGDATKVLHDLWGNPPRTDLLGMLVPANVRLDAPEAWAVVIDYEEEGYVKDDDADKINYTDLLKRMKDGSQEANKKRVQEGYPSIELIGWATAPRYDKAAKKMYWAKELKVDGAGENTLNYNIRVLGRRGVLVLNAIAGMSQLATIERATPEVLRMVEFNEGHRYADFNPKTDKVAAYGLAALVAGGVAAKLGLFKGLLVGLLAAKKFVVIAVVAVVAWIKKLFSSGREEKM